MANWIAGAIKHPGALHRNLGVPQGKKLTLADIARGKRMGGTVAREANLAETLKRMRK